jgi:FtsP/CotA-like multicopper oxidase with cupredoxin domain
MQQFKQSFSINTSSKVIITQPTPLPHRTDQLYQQSGQALHKQNLSKKKKNIGSGAEVKATLPPPTMALLPRAAPARHAQRLLCSLFLCLSLSTLLARAATRRHEWEVSYQFKSPDCVRKLSATINGQTPGPTIRATQGDTVEVKVTNSLLTENLAIHWHGIRQIGTPWADGTEGVTQCPILPGDTFTYAFVVDRPGTYMYHAHYGMQRSAGLYGVIVVAVAEDPGGEVDGAEPFAYDDEHDVLLNDWWHSSTHEQAVGLASVPMVWVGEPHSLLINGRGRFDCSAAAVPGTCNATSPECATPVFAVVPGKTYRFRIASVTSLSALNFEIEVRARICSH